MNQTTSTDVSLLKPPERYEIDSSRLNWPLEQRSGVPGLPDGVAVMPTDRSHAAVLRMPCASGKTYTVRRDLVEVAKGSLIVVVTCNRLFTKATCKDWSVVYGEDNVFCYLDGLGKSDAAKEAKRRLKEMCERKHGVLFVSIESFLVLNDIIDPASVGAILLEETCELASKMLSATCPCVRPFRLLRTVASGAQCVLYTDADFEADSITDGRCLRLAKYLCPDLPVRIFTLSQSAEHTKRSVQLFFDHDDAETGVNLDAWLAQLAAYLAKWRRSGEASGNRVAVACANRGMVRRVCALAFDHGCFWCDYTSDTDDRVKTTELADPETHWVEIALVAFTQTLSVGADPKEIKFAAVFMYVAGFGCTVRALIQGVLRFGRDERYALSCTTVFVCMHGRPTEAPDQAGETTADYYQSALRWLQEQRAERTISEQRMHTAVAAVGRANPSSNAAMLHAYSGVKNVYVTPTDEELGIAAWAVAEQWEQRAQLFSVLKRGFERHGWIANGAALDVQAAAAFACLPTPTADSAALTLHEIAVGKQVSSLMEPGKQYEWALQLIRCGTFTSIDAFYEHCYGVVEQAFLSAPEKVLLRTWSLLRRLPRELVNEVTAEELVELGRRRDAIELHALGICIGSTQLLAQEARKRAESSFHSERNSLMLTAASRIAAFDELAAELMTSVTPSFFAAPGEEEVELGVAMPSVVRALEAARRQQDSADGDLLLQKLRMAERSIGIRDAEDVGLAATLRRVCRQAYVAIKIKTRRVELEDEEELDDAQSNTARRRALVRATGPPAAKRAKRDKREEEIVAVHFLRQTFKVKVDGQPIERDYAIDWQVESPHVKGLLACSRHWQAAHGDLQIPVPAELRHELEEDLGIAEQPPNAPGTGPTEDRPRGNARASGTLTAARFTPARPSRTSAEGYFMCDEALPWERITELMDRVSAQLALSINADMRTMLERGRQVLSRLRRDGSALPTDAQGLRWKPTFYARRMTIGRLTAGASSMQPMPNLLRQWLYRGILHDIDFVNAHPTIMLGLAVLLRPQTWQRDVPQLARYVSERHGFFDAIVRWYGLAGSDFAKTVILVVVNNGELKYWRRRVKSPISPLKPELPCLVELQREVLWLRGIVLSESVFAPMIDPLKERIRSLSRNAGRSEEEITRSAFAYVIGHLESMALEAACAVLKQHGFRPTSMIYDGCLTTHNPTGDLAAALRAAETAVEAALGFPGLELKEKDMFALAAFAIEGSSLAAARQAAVDAAAPLGEDDARDD